MYRKFNHIIWCCELCDNVISLYADRDGANRHNCQHHALKTHPDTCNTNDNVDAIETEFVHDKYFNNLPKEVADLAFFDGLGKEDQRMRFFIRHVHQDAFGKYLVSTSQDRRHTSSRFDQILPEEVEM